jgi:hypothetical protein
MGYSCRADAYNTIAKFNGGQGSSNRWVYKGNHYFWERGREQRDGAITGSIYLMIGDTFAKKVGSFRIDPDGTIAKAPYGMKQAIGA